MLSHLKINDVENVDMGKVPYFCCCISPPSQWCIFIFCWNTLNLESSSIFLFELRLGKKNARESLNNIWNFCLMWVQIWVHIGLWGMWVHIWAQLWCMCGCICECNSVRMVGCNCGIVELWVPHCKDIGRKKRNGGTDDISLAIVPHKQHRGRTLNTKYSWVVCMVFYGML